MAGSGQKTEKPTPKRLQQARREGNFPVAREFVGAMQFLAVVALLTTFTRQYLVQMEEQLRWIFMKAFDPEIAFGEWIYIIRELLSASFKPLAIAGGVLAGGTLGLQLVTTGMGVSLNKLAPSFKRANPMNRLRELPRQNFTSAVKAALLLGLMCFAVYGITVENLNSFLLLPLSSMQVGLARVAAPIEQLLWKIAGLLMIFGAIDLVRQRMRYNRDLRMSKQEIREELKESEGDPHIKGRIRRLRRELLRRKMMQDVPTATAVIVNPTHFAVAIKYESSSMTSPLVVAKGKNYLALRIRQKAVEHGVPIIENPPLARALYDSAEVGQEIPVQFYRAIAEVLAYIYRMMGRTVRAGK
jgi:flagellar biosynthesis protein FlhB